jgi:hypothetical protein
MIWLFLAILLFNVIIGIIETIRFIVLVCKNIKWGWDRKDKEVKHQEEGSETNRPIKREETKETARNRAETLTVHEKLEAGKNYFRRNANKIKFYKVRTTKNSAQNSDKSIAKIDIKPNLEPIDKPIKNKKFKFDSLKQK